MQELQTSYDWEPNTFEFRESFFDTKDFMYLQKGCFFRQRSDIVFQVSENVSHNIHFFSEKAFEKGLFELIEAHEGLCKFLQYSLPESLQSQPTLVSQSTLAQFVHSMEFQIMTWSYELTDCSTQAIEDALMSSKVPLELCYPIFTKFMYMMQVSPYYEDFFH
jgi:hypothetical protein